MDVTEKKTIIITGQSNKYQIKKLLTEKKTDKKRVEIEKLNLSKEYFIFEKQFVIIKNINNILNSEEEKNVSKILIKKF